MGLLFATPCPLVGSTFNQFSLSLHFCKAARSRSLIHVAIGMYIPLHTHIHYPYLRPALCSLKSLLCVMTSTTYLIWLWYVYPCIRTGNLRDPIALVPSSHKPSNPPSPERVEPPSRHECQRIVWAAVFFFRFSAFRPTAHQRLKMLSKNQAGMPSGQPWAIFFYMILLLCTRPTYVTFPDRTEQREHLPP